MVDVGPTSREELPMFRLPDRRKVAALVVILVLVLPWCATAARLGTEPRNNTSALEVLRAGFWGWLRNGWAKEGCTIDPGGKPACGPTSTGGPDSAAPTSNTDAGCTIDPGSPCGGRR